MKALCAGLLACAFLCGCESSHLTLYSAEDPQVHAARLHAAEQAIRTTDAAWLAAAKARDAEKTASFWTDDATIYMPGMPPVSGGKAIRDYVAASFATPGFDISWTTENTVVSPSLDMAYSTGIDTIRYRDTHGRLVTEKNHGVVIWAKQRNGSWKAAVDIATPQSERAPK